MSLVNKGMYNEDIKTKFLNTRYENEESRKVISYLFYNSRRTEEDLGKDIYSFNINDLDKLMRDLDPPNIAVAKSNGSLLSTYIEWAIEEGYRPVVDNPLRGIVKSAAVAWYSKFIGDKKLYFSNEEIDDIIKEIPSSQDKVVLQLAFYEGLKIEEVIELHYNNIDWNKGILKLERGEFTVSEKTLRMIQSAYHDNTYVYLGEEDERELVRSDYVIRNVIARRTKNIGAIGKHTIYTRIKSIKEYFGLENFSYKTLTKSGMIYEAYKLYKEENELDTDQLSRVAEKYGVSKISVRGYEYYNTTILKQFINRENILELYDVDIEK